jgi:putative component of membrane protein insertase Oxa1/YidC/SpoIIIJ protein YidD
MSNYGIKTLHVMKVAKVSMVDTNRCTKCFPQTSGAVEVSFGLKYEAA